MLVEWRRQRRRRAVLRGGETIEVSPADLPPLKAEPEDLPVEILYEDAAVIAIYKPAGLVVHAGAGAHSGTLVNRLVHHFASLRTSGGELRPGIVHRLDRGTSGVLAGRANRRGASGAGCAVCRTDGRENLSGAGGRADCGGFRSHDYADYARSRTAHSDDGAVGTRPRRRSPNFESCGVLRNSPTSKCASAPDGRTRSARIWLRIGYPVAGDRLYGAQGARERFFLHAWRIGFVSPATGQRVEGGCSTGSAGLGSGWLVRY